MADGYDIVFPPKGRQLLDGGKNSKYERSIIPDNESPDCLNVVFGNGAVATRPGAVKLNTLAIGSFVCDGLYTRRDNTGAETMVAFAGGTAWQLATTTFSTIASAQSVFTAGVRIGTAQYQNHMFVGNGYVTPYKWNGTDFTRHGVPAASGAVSVASASTSTGVLTGEYRYKVAYVNSAAAIGDVGSATATITFASAKGILTVIPTAPQSHGVNSRRVYRTEAGGSTWKLLTTLSDNTTTTYVDNTADASLGTNAPTDNGEPPVYSVAVYHQNRLFVNDAANPNYVWYSELFEPFTFASTNFLPIGDASFDLVKGLEVHDNGVVVLCERTPHMIIMPSADPTEWGTVRLKSPYGSRSPFGCFHYHNKLMYPAMESDKFVGFAALAGGTVDPEATHLETSSAGADLKSDRVETDIFDVQEAYVKNISAQTFKNKAYVAVTSGDNQTTNNKCFIFDYSISNLKEQEASWAPLDGLNVAQFTVYNQRLYYGNSTATGFVYQLESSATLYSDDGAAINSYFWTKEFPGLKGHENLQKDFRRVKILVDQPGNYYMNLTYRVDSDSGDGLTTQVQLNPGANVWGTLIWGAGTWGSGASQREAVITLGQVTGKRIQFRFSNQNTAGQRFKVHGLNFTYNIKGRR